MNRNGAEKLSESEDTIKVLKTLPGGEELAAVLGTDTEFHDAEIVSVRLDRELGSEVVISLPWIESRVVFVFDEWIDVQLLSFSRQNVIGGMCLRKAAPREPGFAEIGVGYIPAEIDFEFLPCYGAHGTISGRVKAIRTEATTNITS